MRRWERDIRRECQSLAEQANVAFAIKVGPHLRITITGPAGARGLTTSGTPSDVRAIHNFRRDFVASPRWWRRRQERPPHRA